MSPSATWEGGQPMPIHEAAARGFQQASEVYERGRPTYPPEAIERLVAALGIGPGATVVDLAAGTGKLTRQLVPSGARLLAVEPVEAMRATFARVLPGVTILEGTAEAMPLPDASADAVVVGQAFHWFDGPAALAEIHRVLRPGGHLGLIWNVRDESVAWMGQIAALTAPYRATAPSGSTGDWRTAFATTPLFTPLAEWHIASWQDGDATTVVDRVA